jgi:hypothetical protein
MSASGQNRPFKFGANDRREFIVQDSEVSFIAINDLNGNPIYLGRAKVGSALSEPKWQIRFIEYDSNQGVTRVTWPVNDESAASADFEFIWTAVSDLTITTISQAATAVVTVSDLGTLANGDLIVIQDVAGMTDVNFDGSNIYTVANISAGPKTFELSGINSSAFGAYTSGGIVIYGAVVNYTYS